MRKKTTFFVSTISNGGAEAVCVNIANGLAERGWQVDLLVLHTKEQAYLERLSPKVNLVDLKANRARYAAPALLWYVLRNRPKQLVVFKYELIDLVVMLKKLFRFNTKIIGRNISILSESRKASGETNRRSLVKRWLGTPIEQVDCLINQSYEMQKDLLQHHPVLKDRSVVIHNPVAAHIEAYAKANPRKNVNREYILCVGRLAPEKAFHQAISAFALIANQYPKLRLKFVGQGELQQELQQHACELGIADRVDFDGFQDDVIPYYRNASLTLLTSKFEGFPNVLIESIVLGTPVVSFDCPSGPREILDYGKYGKLVTLADVSALASAIEDVLANPCQFNLTERAEAFNFENAVDKYERCLIKYI